MEHASLSLPAPLPASRRLAAWRSVRPSHGRGARRPWPVSTLPTAHAGGQGVVAGSDEPPPYAEDELLRRLREAGL